MLQVLESRCSEDVTIRDCRSWLLAVSIGFVAWTFPIQADANWVALGWAAMGLSLWYFGMRIASGELRILAAAMTGLAVGRVLAFDLPLYIRDPFIPIFNTTAFPSLCVSLIVLAGYSLLTDFRSCRRLPNAGGSPCLVCWA